MKLPASGSSWACSLLAPSWQRGSWPSIGAFKSSDTMAKSQSQHCSAGAGRGVQLPAQSPAGQCCSKGTGSCPAPVGQGAPCWLLQQPFRPGHPSRPLLQTARGHQHGPRHLWPEGSGTLIQLLVMHTCDRWWCPGGPYSFLETYSSSSNWYSQWLALCGLDCKMQLRRVLHLCVTDSVPGGLVAAEMLA